LAAQSKTGKLVVRSPHDPPRLIGVGPLKLIVTIPALNEEKTIGKVVGDIPRDIPGISWTEVIVLNDGSTDRTAELAAEAGATVITLRGRRGLGPVFRTGMMHAIRGGADIIVNVDGDGQFDSRDVAKLIRPIIKNEADFVTCSRFGDPNYQPHMSPEKYWGNKVVTWMINRLCGLNLTDVSCGFRAYNREAAYRLAQFGRWTYVEECVVDLSSKGMRIMEMPLRVRGEREFGKSRVAASVIRYGTNLVQIVFRAARDIRPFQIFGLLSALMVLPALALGAGLFVWFLVRGHTEPFSAILLASGAMLVAGFVLFLLALIAEMVTVHRGLSEELLYLARQRLYARRRAAAAMAVSRRVAGPDQAPWEASAPPGVQPASHEAPLARAVVNARSTIAATESTATSAMHHGGLHLTEG
jgi:glycosyltransferase involved in cell wall biosynthesis